MNDRSEIDDGKKVASHDYLEDFLDEGTERQSGGVPTMASTDTEDPAEKNDNSADPEGALRLRVIEQIRTIYDPEIPVNIYDLGLIYAVDVDAGDQVIVTMTLTTPHCPVAEIMPAEVETRVGQVDGVGSARVNLVWDPPWDPSRMTEAAQLELGFL